MINALTIDVEDYYHVTAFEKTIRMEDWPRCQFRVADNTLRILDTLDQFSVKATFFVLGWVAEQCPPLIKEIQRRGHEIGCHGYAHQRIYTIGPHRFRNDVRRARMLLEDICSTQIRGYRAPSYSITKDSLWALDILLEENFTYDSSIFPIMHDLYGIRNADRFPYSIERPHGMLREFPLSTLEIKLPSAKVRIPIAGGGYLRLFPVSVIKHAVDYVNTHERQPVVIYFHPWEIDPLQPRIKAGVKSRFRHYLNLDKTLGKITYLLRTVRFSTMEDALANI